LPGSFHFHLSPLSLVAANKKLKKPLGGDFASQDNTFLSYKNILSREIFLKYLENKVLTLALSPGGRRRLPEE
jgi:hypothetical protein